MPEIEGSDVALTDDTGHLDESTLDRRRTGELDAAERENAEAHLAACPLCAAAAVELDAFAAALASGYAALETAAVAQAPDGRAQRSAILARTSGARPGRGAWTRWVPQLAAVLVAVVAVGVLAERGVRGPGSAAEEATEGVPSVAETTPGEARRAETAAGQAREADAGQAPAAPPPAAAKNAAGRDAALQDGATPEAERAEALRDAVDAPPPPPEPRPSRDEAAAGLRRQAPAPDAAAPLPLDRFLASGRAALEREDPPQAKAALALWRDTLAPAEAGLAAADSAATADARALADSLAVWLGALPR